jgi:hypothetical protein
MTTPDLTPHLIVADEAPEERGRSVVEFDEAIYSDPAAYATAAAVCLGEQKIENIEELRQSAVVHAGRNIGDILETHGERILNFDDETFNVIMADSHDKKLVHELRATRSEKQVAEIKRRLFYHRLRLYAGRVVADFLDTEPIIHDNPAA